MFALSRTQGFAFSGCIVVGKKEKDSLKKVGRLRRWIRLKHWTLSKPLVILVNLFFIWETIKPLFVGYEPKNEIDNNDYLDISTNGTNKQFRITDYDNSLRSIAWTNESKELAQLKPILRFILKCMVYVFLIEECVVHAYNILFGGLFIIRVLNCKEFALADQSRSFAKWTIFCIYALAFLLRSISLWVYEWEAINAILHSQMTSSHLIFSLRKLLAESIYFMLHFVALSLYSIWFAYCMLHSAFCIDQLQKEVMRCKSTIN